MIDFLLTSLLVWFAVAGVLITTLAFAGSVLLQHRRRPRPQRRARVATVHTGRPHASRVQLR